MSRIARALEVRGVIQIIMTDILDVTEKISYMHIVEFSEVH